MNPNKPKRLYLNLHAHLELFSRRHLTPNHFYYRQKDGCREANP